MASSVDADMLQGIKAISGSTLFRGITPGRAAGEHDRKATQLEHRSTNPATESAAPVKPSQPQIAGEQQAADSPKKDSYKSPWGRFSPVSKNPPAVKSAGEGSSHAKSEPPTPMHSATTAPRPEPTESLIARGTVRGVEVEFVAQSILDLHVDAIVNAAHSSLRHGGGICDIIHNAAGTRLTDECAKVRAEHGSDYAAGNAAITRAFDLEKNGIKFVVHAVGPNLQDMHVTEKTIFSPRNEKHVTALMDAYKNSLERANERGCQSIALPRISAGIFKFPLVAQALCATRAVNEWIAANPGSSIKKIQFCELPGGVSSKKSNAWLNVYKEFITSGGITE